MRVFVLAVIPCLLIAQDGFMPILGGLPFDSGFALGVEYRKLHLAGGLLDFSAKAIGSTKKYEFLEAAVGLPRLLNGRLFAEARVRYRNYTQEDFWGLGPRSSRDLRTTFRLEDIAYTGMAGVRPKPWLAVGFTSGRLGVNTGPGKDEDRPSIEQRFMAVEVPALDRQPHYLQSGVFLDVDYRDKISDPQFGGFYQFRLTNFHDLDFGHFHFRRYEIDLRQFLPVFQRSDTIAARALAILSEKNNGRQVPFFLQPTVGGGNDLRGYHQYRFRDENALAFNLEYRWRIREMLHVVSFADAARVFSRPGQIGFSGLRGSFGIGGRLRLGESFVFGLDIGFSPDGAGYWFRGADTF